MKCKPKANQYESDKNIETVYLTLTKGTFIFVFTYSKHLKMPSLSDVTTVKFEISNSFE